MSAPSEPAGLAAQIAAGEAIAAVLECMATIAAECDDPALAQIMSTYAAEQRALTAEVRALLP